MTSCPAKPHPPLNTSGIDTGVSSQSGLGKHTGEALSFLPVLSTIDNCPFRPC